MRPLRGRVVLIVGGDPAARSAALHLSAHGASVVLAAACPSDAVETAGLVASQGGTARVVEAPSPPLLGAALLSAAAQALAPATDVLVSEVAFATAEAARDALRDLAAGLPPEAVAALAAGDAASLVASFLERRR